MTSFHDEYVGKDGKCSICHNYCGNSSEEFSLHIIIYELRKIRELLEDSKTYSRRGDLGD